MERHCHCKVQGADCSRGGVGCASGGRAFCGFYDLGWLTGCGCHGGHGYPPLDGVDKKSGEVGGLPEARGAGPHCLPSSAGNNNQYRLAWQPTKKYKRDYKFGSHTQTLFIELCTSEMSSLISTLQHKRMKKQIPGDPNKMSIHVICGM